MKLAIILSVLFAGACAGSFAYLASRAPVSHHVS
jgi:hypothetical protein